MRTCVWSESTIPNAGAAVAAWEDYASPPGAPHGPALRHTRAVRVFLAAHGLRLRLPNLLLLARHGHYSGRSLPGSYDEGEIFFGDARDLETY